MAIISDILENLRETDAMLTQMQRVAVQNPNSTALRLTVSSLAKRQNELERAFAVAAEDEWLDVCSYRLFDYEDTANYLVTGIVKAIDRFQGALITTYDSVKNGPKDRARPDMLTVKESSMGFGYAFTGSVGFVMTMPNERVLFGESNLDRAMSIIFKIAKSEDPAMISEYARELGAAPIRKIYLWAEDHVAQNLNVDIKWLRNNEVLGQLRADVDQLQRLKDVINSASDEEVTLVEVPGFLIGADGANKKFHMSFPGTEAEEIRGFMADTLAARTIEINTRYHAKLQRTSKVYFSTEKEQITWVLLDLANQ